MYLKMDKDICYFHHRFLSAKLCSEQLTCYTPGHEEQSVMCQTADKCLTADPWVTSLIPARPGPILSQRLIMKKFPTQSSPFSLFRKGCCQLQAKGCA